MPAWSAQIVPSLLNAQHSPDVTTALGTDIMGSDKATYNVNLELLVLLSMTLKIIQDLAPATVTDAFLQQRLAIALDTGASGDRSGWPGWVLLQIKPEDLAQYGATMTDSPATLQAKIDAYHQANP